MPSELSFTHADYQQSKIKCVKFTNHLPFQYNQEVEHLSTCKSCSPMKSRETMIIHIIFGWVGSKGYV